MISSLKVLELSKVTLYSGRYLYSLLRIGLTVSPVIVTELGGGDVVQMLVLVRSFKLISFHANIREMKLMMCHCQKIQFLLNLDVSSASRLL